MAKVQQLFKGRLGRVIVATIFLWCSLFDAVGRSQILPLRQLNKLPKPCFAETEELPSPPLSQTEPSIPSLWLEKDIYGEITQRTETPSVQNTVAEETVNLESEGELEEPAEQNVPPLDLIEPDNQLLETWFVQNQDFVQLSPILNVNNLATLVVDRQKWHAERYIGQYVFINRFGTTAREYGYNLRICNNKGDFLGYYICDFQTAPLDCQVFLRSEGFRLRDFRIFESLSPQ